MTSVTRREGPRPAITALVSQIHPVFMLPPVAVSLIGSILAGEFSLTVAFIHAGAIFFAVYTAHVKDGYVDFYVRDEDEDHPMTATGCRVTLVGSTIAFAVLMVALWVTVDVWAVVLTVPTWFLGYFHAPHLDMNPVTASVSYPLGIALALVGGYYVQSGAIAAMPIAFAVVLLVILSGVKVIDDAQDVSYDQTIQKRTVAVVLGIHRGRLVGYGLMGVGLLGVIAITASGIFPLSSVVAVFVFGAVAAVANTKEPEIATMLLVRGAYLFLAAFVVAVWYRPMEGPVLLDLSVFGQYTYILSEFVFGLLAFVLLWRANALRRAVQTIAAVYPLAYIWDWYSLEIGIFEIRLRTGIDLLGIPIEEHLFMIVVPALVIAFHELLHTNEAPSRRIDQ